jgi:uncharacterized repeat protein (TIGR01451 family)/fimbrial isopeptide formation D2 family protein
VGAKWWATRRRLTLLAILAGVAGAFHVTTLPRVDAQASTPGGVAIDLDFWVKANAGVTAGTTFVWADQSGSVFGREARQATDSLEPNVEAGFNFNPVLNFDGSDYLGINSLTGFPVGTNDRTVLAVANRIGTGWGFIFSYGNNFNGQLTALGQAANSETILSGWGSPYDLIVGGPSGNWSETARVVTGTRSGTTSRLFANSTQIGSGTFDWNTFLSEGLIGKQVGIDQFWNGRIAEVILYGRNLTSTERLRVESYLALKYGITLGNNAGPFNYLASDGGTIWLASTTYQNNVTGIGRDDGSALAQKQSRTEDATPGFALTMGLGTIAADNAANPNTFSVNDSFLIWGNNGASTNFETPITPPAGIGASLRTPRIWTVQETGTVGAVKVGIPPGTGGGAPVYLVVSTDTTFNGSDQWVPLTAFTAGSTSYLAGNFDFTHGQFFTFAGLNAAPGGVATSFRLWLKADVGVTPGIAGIGVETWTDQSGANNHGFQSSALERPLYRDVPGQLMNFNPVLEFDDTNNWVRVNLDVHPSELDPLSVAMVHKTVNAGGLYGNEDSGFDLGHFTTAVSGNNAFVPYSGAGNTGVPVINGAHYNHGAFNGSFVYINDREALNFTYNNVLSANRYLSIGVNGAPCAACDDYFGGTITEFILYGRALTAVERQRIDSYLGVKYGITLDQSSPTNYLDSNGTVIWNATANAAQRNNIAGIGRDDLSALGQKQSQSVNIAASGNLVTIGRGTIAIDNKSNSSTFAADRTFLMWGDDGGSTSLTTTVTAPAGLTSGRRMARIWKTQETGAVAAVKVAVPVATGSGSPLYLVVSNDSTFDGSDQWVPTGSLTAGSTSYRAADFDFGATQFFTFATAQGIDFGDLPASYGTLLANDGARHAVPTYNAATNTAALMLGARIDVEADGQPSANATGDDTLGIDDEDGVTFPSLVAGTSANLAIAVTNIGAQARLNAWADWNRNGAFEATERIAADVLVANGSNTLPVNVPATAGDLTSFRFRLSTLALGTTGEAPDGEVESYQVAVLKNTDLVISKTDGAATYVPGAPISYTVVVTNAGPSSATGVSVTDTVPAAITGVSVTCAMTGTASCGTNGSSGNSVSFTGAGVAAGAGNQLTLTIAGTVSATATGNLSNTATVVAGTGQTDPVPANNSAIDTDTPGIGSADLELTKSDGQSGYVAGTPITYTLTVTNAGPSNATTLTLSDAVPVTITGVSAGCVATGMASCGTNASSGNTVSFTGANLNAGAAHRLTITINGTISPLATGDLVNTAELTIPGGAGYTDPNQGNNTATDRDTAGTPQVDLAITKTDGEATYVPGAPITYTLQVTNAGPSVASGFSVADVVPAALSGVTATCTVAGFGACGHNDSSGNTVSFTNASLAPGAGNFLAITIGGTVNPSTTGPLSNTATVTAGAGTNEPNTANNSATDTSDQGAGRADLSISKTDGTSSYTPGTPITYTVTVTNAGPSHATAFDVTDAVPATITGMVVGCVPAGTADCGTNASVGNDVRFTGARLNAGAAHSLTITIAGTISPAVAGALVNSATVSVPSGSGYTDPLGANNSATDSDTAGAAQVDLGIIKSDGQTSYIPGAPISYTIVVTNAGPSLATDVTVRDIVPASIAGVTATCVASGSANCGTNASENNDVRFTNATVPPPGVANSLTITVNGTVGPDMAGALVNTATVTAGPGATETNTANNSQTDTNTQADGVADLEISKTDGTSVYVAGAGITYHVTVRNNGPSHATGFSIDDVVPGAITAVAVTCAVSTGVGTCGTNASAGNTIAFRSVNLNTLSELTLTIAGTIAPSATGDLANTASVTVPAGSGFADPNANNDVATDIDTQGAQQVDLAIVKDDGQTTYVPGTPIVYTLTVTNAGPSTATGFSVEDILPDAILNATVTCVTTGAADCGTSTRQGGHVGNASASLSPGGTIVVTITGTIDPAATGDLVNTATVTAGAGAIDANPGNNTATDTDTQATPQVDLAIGKDNGRATYVPGANVSYTILVTNAGPSTATGVAIADAVPASIGDVSVSCTASGSGSCGTDSSTGNSIAFADAIVPPDSQLQLIVIGTVAPSAAGNIVNTATVTAGAGSTDSNPANNTATDTDTPGSSQIDLKVTKSNGQLGYVPGTPITWTLPVTNAGPSTAVGFTISDPVPAAVTGVTATCTVTGTGSCGTNASSGNNVLFTGAILPPGAGQQLTVTISGTVDPGATGLLSNTASVAPGPGSVDTAAINDHGTDNDPRDTAQVDLAITKTDGQTTYVPGTPIAYTIAVTNTGPSTATGVTIADVVPSIVEGVSATCTATGAATCGSDGSVGNSVQFTSASLAPGASLTLTVSGIISPDAGGALTNIATVTAGAGSTDTNPVNNSATDSDAPGIPQIDLSVTKTNGQTTYVPGTPVSYTITVANAGPSSASGFTLSDSVPAAITGVVVTCNMTGAAGCGADQSSGNVLNFTDMTLSPGAGNLITLTVTGTISPAASGSLSNTANVFAGAVSNDTNAANNTATDTDTQGTSQIDLTVTKTNNQTSYVPGAPTAYTIRVVNAGPSSATGFSVADVVPTSIGSVTVVCVANDTGSCGTNASSGNNISFTNATLPPGGGNDLTLTVSGTINSAAAGNISNTATVTPGAGSIDANPGDNSATDIDTQGTSQVDLAVTKSNGQTTYVPGTAVSYTIVVTNAGPSAAIGVTVTDSVPGVITGVTVTCAASGTATCGTNGSSGNNVSFTGASVPPGGGNSLTLTVSGTVSPGASGDIVNTVTVAAGPASTDPNAGNNSATDTDTPGAGQTDLAVTKTNGQSTYVPGAAVTYTVVVTNAGPSNASGVSIADLVSAAITGVSVTCVLTGTASCGTNASSGNSVSFTGASVAAGAGNQLMLTIAGIVSATATGDLANTVNVSAGAGQSDSVLANNSATDTDTPGAGRADLAVTKTDGQAGYVAGTPITYTVTVTNAGPSNAPTLNVSDIVPAVITGVSAACVAAGTASCGTNASSGNTVSFTGASLNAGAGNSLTVTITGTISPSATGDLVNTAEVTVPGGAGYTDPNLGNNTATDTDTAGTPQIDLAITKTDGQATYVPGAPIAYTVRVTNAGPSLASGFSVADAVPASLTSVTAACAVEGFGSCGTNGSSGGSVAFANASLAPGAGNVLTITINGTVSPNTTGQLSNTATVTAAAGTSEANTANNSATDTSDQGEGRADLSISKTDGRTSYVPGTAISYVVTVTNLGPSHAPSFEVHDIVPAFITGVTAACAPSGTAGCETNGSSGNSIAFTGASLNAGAGNSLTITINGTIVPGATGNLSNTAQITIPAGAGYSDPATGNNTAMDVDTPGLQQVDLAIQKTDGQTAYVPGAPIVYVLTVTNTGPSTATDVRIADTVPAAITGVVATCLEARALATTSCGSNDSAGQSVVFSNASVVPGDSVTITIRGTVNPDTTGNLANTATVTAGPGANEANLANNTATDTNTQAAGIANLTVSKTDGKAVYVPGTSITYQIVVANLGPSHASGFSIDDVVPPTITGVTVSCALTNGIGTCGTNSSSGNTVAFADVGLNAGAELTLTVTGTIEPSATGDLVNTATVTIPAGAGFADPDTSNNVATDTDTSGPQEVDLAITKDDGQTTYVPGTPIRYTISVSNTGPSTATGFTIDDPLPAAITNVTVTCTATGAASCGSSTRQEGPVHFNNTTANVSPGGTLTLTVDGTIDPAATGDLVNTATVTAGPGAVEANTANNSATDTDTQATPLVDLAITKTDGQASYVAGAPIEYTVTVTNAGPSTATGASITDAVPASITGVTATCAVNGSGECGTNASTGNNIAFTGARLTPGAGNALTITVTGTIDAAATGSLVNTATVTAGAGTADTVLANNTATDTDTAGTSQVDLAITKVAGAGSVVPGTAIGYTITVSNAGPSTAAGVGITDAVPATIAGVTVTCTPSGMASCGTNASAGNSINFTGASLAPGAGNLLTLAVSGVVDPAATGSIVNTATVAAGAGSTDPAPGNNSATSTVSLTPRADVQVLKTGNASVVPGASVFYTITVTNAGPSVAADVVLTDPAPAGLGPPVVSGACTVLPCALGALAPNVPSVVTVSFPVPPDYSGLSPIRNTATAMSTTADPVPGNNSASADTTVTPRADLSIAKTGTVSVLPGSTIHYVITVTNLGLSDAFAVTVADVTPPGLTFVSNTGDCATPFPCALGTVPAGATRTINATFVVTPAYLSPNPIVNTTSVSSATPDPVAANNTATAQTQLIRDADVAVIATVAPATASTGDTVTLTITVGNRGPNRATGVEITDILPPGLQFVSAAPGQGTYDAVSGEWAVGVLNVSATAELTITATVTGFGTIANVVAKTSQNEPDPNPANDTAVAMLNAAGLLADVAVNKTVDRPDAAVGETATFTVHIVNRGPDSATGIVVADALPAGLTLLSSTPSQGSYAGGTWSVGALNVGSEATLTITASVDTSATLINHAAVTAQDQTDPNPANNGDPASIHGAGTSDIRVTKTVSQPAPAVGALVTYTVAVTNLGPEVATPVAISDLLPAGVTFVSAAPSQGSYEPVTGTWSVGALSATSTRTLTITARVAQTGTIVNTASRLASAPADPNPVNDSASASIAPIAVADVAVTKTLTTVPIPGLAASYIIVVTNNGPSPVTGVTVSDTFPPAFMNPTWVCAADAGSVCSVASGSGNLLALTVDLEAGDKATITVTGTLASGATGPLANTANVGVPAAVTDPIATNNTATSDVVLMPRADVRITKSGPAQATPGTDITYTLTVTNAGPSDAVDVVLSESTPPGLTLVSISAPCGAGFPCALGPIAAGAPAQTVTVTFAVPSGYTTPQPISNTASVSSATVDPATGNNSATASTTTSGAAIADLGISKSNGVTTIVPGTTTTYTIVVTNAGPSDAPGARVVDSFPAELTGVTWTCAATAGSACPASGAGHLDTTIDVAVGGTITFTVTGTIAPDAVGLMVNTASAFPPAAVTDPNSSNNTDSDLLTPEADLSITKVGPAATVAGTSLVYTIVVTNNGPSNAADVRVSDTTPAGLIFVSNSGDCVTAFPCDLGTLPPSQSRTITATFDVPPTYTAPDPIVNTASVSSPTTDPNASNNAVTVQTRLSREADVEISKSGTPSNVRAGETVTFVLTAINHGPAPVNGLEVTDLLPEGVAYVSDVPLIGAYDPATGRWTIGFLPVNGTAQLSITATATSPDTVTNLAVKSGQSESDPNPVNDSAAATVNGGIAADVSLGMSVTPATAAVGQTVTFTVRAANRGADTATGLTIADALPAGLTLVSATPSPGAYSGGVWTVGTLAEGAEATLIIEATVDVPGPLVNHAAVASQDQVDPNPLNNSAAATVNGAGTADLRVTKAVSNMAPSVGDQVTYTIGISNLGPDAATDVTIADVLPANTTFVSATASEGTYDSGTGAWTLATLPATGTETLVLTARVDDVGAITNTASRQSSTPADPNPANDSGSATLTAGPTVDLIVTTTTSPPVPVASGTPLTWTITVTNAGPNTAVGASVVDAIPAELTNVTWTCTSSAGSTCGASTGTGNVLTTIDVAPAGTVTFVVNGLIVPAATGSLTNVTIATVAFGTTEADPTDNIAIGGFQILPAEVRIVKSGPDAAVPGTTVTYTLTVTNTGPSYATAVTVTDPTPAGLELVSVSGACTALPCTIDVLPPGVAAQIAVAFRIPPVYAGPATFLNVATVAAPNDADLTNNVSSVPTTVSGAVADLTIVKTKNGAASVSPGSVVTYTIVVTNNGPSTADQVQVSDTTPPGLVFVSTSGACTTAFPCALGSLGTAETRTITATYQIPLDYSGPNPIENTAVVSSSTPDSNGANDSSTVRTAIGTSSCDLNGDGRAELVISAGPNGGPHVRVLDVNGGRVTELASFYAYDPAFAGGVFVACRDVSGDGVPDIITGAGPGGAPHVRAFDFNGGNLIEIATFYAYDDAFRGGVQIAAADVTGDGVAEIITGPGVGMEPRVRVLSVLGGVYSELGSFLAYDPAFQGGVSVAAGDVTGDGVADIITGAGAGGAPHVRAFNFYGGSLAEVASFYAYAEEFPGGVQVASADVTGDGVAEIITGAGPGGGPHVRVIEVKGGVFTERAGIYAYDPAFGGGVFVAAADLTGDGVAEIITGAGPGGGPHVRAFDFNGGNLTEIVSIYGFDEAWRGGVRVSARAEPGDGVAEAPADSSSAKPRQSGVSVWRMLRVLGRHLDIRGRAAWRASVSR